MKHHYLPLYSKHGHFLFPDLFLRRLPFFWKVKPDKLTEIACFTEAYSSASANTMVANSWPTPGMLRPFDPTKYAPKKPATTKSAIKDSAVQPHILTQTEHHLAEKVSESINGHIPDTEGADHEPYRDVVIKAEKKRKKKKSKSSALPAAEAIAKSETLESCPDETLRLASLRLVNKIHRIKVNNRYLDFAEIDGWTCLVPPCAFREGDLVLYFENDSLLPATDSRFASLKPLQTFDGKLGYRVKTRRFGTDELKIVTQGYIYPVEKFPEIWDEVNMVRQVVAIGPEAISESMVNLIVLAIYRMTNWAERLGVKKWAEAQPAQPQSVHVKLGNFPKHIFSGTNITRLQDCPNLFLKAKYQRQEYQESIKKDGASMTVYFVKDNSCYFDKLNPLPGKFGPNTILDNGRFGVCSKNVDLNELQSCNFGYWETGLRYNLPAKLSKVGRNIAINGELCGEGINGNREGIPAGTKEFFVYSIFDIDRQKYLNPREVVARAMQLGLKHVPVLGYIRIPEIAKSHSELQRRADEKEGEGSVFKCVTDGRSFKVLSDTYLKKHDL